MLCTIKWTLLGQVFHLKVIFKLKDRIIRTTVNNSKWTCTTNSFFNSILTNNNKTNSTPAPSRDFRLQLLELITPKVINLVRMATPTFILLSRISSISKCNKRSSNNLWRTSKWTQTIHGTSPIKTKIAEHQQRKATKILVKEALGKNLPRNWRQSRLLIKSQVQT